MSDTKKIAYDNTLKNLSNLKITAGYQSNQIDFLKKKLKECGVSLESIHNSLDRIELEYRRGINK